jgi:hypothetical protein
LFGLINATHELACRLIVFNRLCPVGFLARPFEGAIVTLDEGVEIGPGTGNEGVSHVGVCLAASIVAGLLEIYLPDCDAFFFGGVPEEAIVKSRALWHKINLPDIAQSQVDLAFLLAIARFTREHYRVE